MVAPESALVSVSGAVGPIPYLFLDATSSTRSARTVENVSAFVAYGIGLDGKRQLLAVTIGAKDSEDRLAQLNERALSGVELVADAHAGLRQQMAAWLVGETHPESMKGGTRQSAAELRPPGSHSSSSSRPSRPARPAGRLGRATASPHKGIVVHEAQSNSRPSGPSPHHPQPVDEREAAPVLMPRATGHVRRVLGS